YEDSPPLDQRVGSTTHVGTSPADADHAAAALAGRRAGDVRRGWQPHRSTTHAFPRTGFLDDPSPPQGAKSAGPPTGGQGRSKGQFASVVADHDVACRERIALG